jgi:hypothetical protein
MVPLRERLESDRVQVKVRDSSNATLERWRELLGPKLKVLQEEVGGHPAGNT